MAEGLISKIEKIDEQVAKDLRDGGLTNDDIKNLCFEALKEVIPVPGLKGTVLRSRIWKVISSENTETSGSCKRKIDSICVENVDDSDESLNSSCSSTMISCSTPIIKSKGKESSSGSDPFNTSRNSISHAKSPQYTIYCDPHVDLARKAGKMPPELVHRLIRGTVDNMISTAFNPPWNRMPTTDEVMEMAKSLIITYPQLSDDATKHLVVFKKLKKRLYNIKPVEKKNPKKKVKKDIVKKKDDGDDEIGIDEEFESPTYSGETSNQLSAETSSRSNGETSSWSSGETSSRSSGETSSPSNDEQFSQQIMDRHYNALLKEMQKGTPSPRNINLYLNKEFEGRRRRIQNMAAEDRHIKLFEAYPCLKDNVEIIEEVRRILKRAEQDKPRSFMNECIQRLQNEMDFLIYFGVSKKSVGHPSKPTTTAKIIHILKHINGIFGGVSRKTSKNARKSIADLVYVIKENEDPEQVCSKKQGNGLTMLVDSNTAYIIFKGSILLTIEVNKILEAVLAFIGMFYVLDIDYPPSHELGLSVLHNLIFEDKSSPEELLTPFNTAIEEYSKFKNSA